MIRILAAAALALAFALPAHAKQIKHLRSASAFQHHGGISDVSSARRHHRLYRNRLHHDGMGRHRVATGGSRDGGSARATVAMDIAQADRDGRWGARIDRPREAAPKRWRTRYAALGPVARQSGPVHRIARAIASIGAGLASIPGELAAKVAQIAGACPGFHIISACRPGARVAGTNITSLHASCRAADIAGGSYGCAYAQLQGWPGGYSIDANRVAHIHMSWAPGSREFGSRFVHGGGGRYARHHARRYAHHWRGRRG